MQRAQCVVFASAVFALLSADGFSISFDKPVKLGGSRGSPFWRPRGGVGFGKGKAALTIQTKGEGCTCDGSDGGEAKCAKPCTSSGHSVMFTADFGARFHTYSGEKHFCGAMSVGVEGEDGGPTVRHCPDIHDQTPTEDSVTMPVVEWTLTEGGTLTNPSLTHAMVDKKVTVSTSAIKDDIPSSVTFGNNILDMKDKQLMLRLATVKYDDSNEHVILKSKDHGYSWASYAKIPIDIGERNSLERFGENDLRVFVSLGNSTILKTQSRTLGRKWDNVTESTDYHNLPTVVTAKFTTHMSGGRAGPVLYSLGAKKGSNQYFSLGDEHNRHMDDAEDFSTEFLESIGTRNKSDSDVCDQPPFPKDATQCGSTGVVDVTNLGTAEEGSNMTDLMLCYDKLGAGYNSEEEDAVYCMKARVNETKEQIAFDTKQRKKEEKEAADKLYREEMERRAEEARIRKRDKRREKLKKVKEQRARWQAVDSEQNLAPARVFEQEDDELIVVRDMTKNAEFLEFMDEEVGLPGKPSEEEDTADTKAEEEQ